MIQRVQMFLELVRFSHTIFALPFALTSAALAWHVGDGFHVLQLVGILLCMMFARSAAMGFNRLVDREQDATNPRTKSRHLPAGLLRVSEVWGFVLACSLGFVLSTYLFWHFFDNRWPTYLAIPVLCVLLAYSLTKRFTSLCHFWLGLSLFLSPVAAWIAIRGFPDWPLLKIPLLLGGAVLFWVAGFDILYATQDLDHDRKAQLHSVPARFGVGTSLRIAMLSHLVMLGFLFALFFVTSVLGWVYLAGILGVTVLLVYEHWLVRPDDLSRVNQAFFQVNGIISVGLFGLVLLQLAVGSLTN